MVLWTRNRSTEKKKKPQWFTYSVEVRGKISEKDRIELYRKNRNHLGNNWCLNYNGEITANNRGYVYFFFIRHNGTSRAISGDITNSIKLCITLPWIKTGVTGARTLLFTSKIADQRNARSHIENHRCWNQISPMCAGKNLLSMKPCVTHLCAVPCYINPEMTRYNANDIPNGILMKYPHVCCLPEAKLT